MPHQLIALVLIILEAIFIQVMLIQKFLPYNNIIFFLILLNMEALLRVPSNIQFELKENASQTLTYMDAYNPSGRPIAFKVFL